MIGPRQYLRLLFWGSWVADVTHLPLEHLCLLTSDKG